MSLSWLQRKTRLAPLLKSQDDDEDAQGIAIDRLMHGQSIIGKTAKTAEVDSLRFKDSDLDVVGTLEYGQFGVIHVVTCRLNNCVYVRKSIEKRFALRTRDQCSPQYERDLLLQAVKTDSPWAPHLLCAYQTSTHLNLVMDYAEGGTLWDVLESSPYDGRVLESDLMWWAPQLISAIHWCHSQGFAHRDIKPHNFVLTPDAHVLLIDFGSAAPLLPPKEDGTQLIPKRHCLVPCGTCDYISPEILQAHEEALVALEMEDDELERQPETEGYGVETDWWSLGAMLYEMAYGVAPFFANDIRQTYVQIMNHERGLRFDQKVPISHEYQHFIRRLLTHAKQRLGRRNVMEITDHPLFERIDWANLSTQSAPEGLHLPQFTYSEPKPATTAPIQDDSRSLSQGFAFSALFQSSNISPGLSVLTPSPALKVQHPSLSISWQDNSGSASSFIGFSWGPSRDAFLDEIVLSSSENTPYTGLSSPHPLLRTPLHRTPVPTHSSPNTLSVPTTWMLGTPMLSTPRPMHAYSTPLKPYAMSGSPYATLPRTSTVRRTAPRRIVSDREAMKQLVECVGMSARKKVLESGRKPKILGIFGSRGTSKGNSLGTAAGRSMNYGTLRKELRFDRFTTPIPGPDYSGVSSNRSRGQSAGVVDPNGNTNDFDDPSSNIYYQPDSEDNGNEKEGYERDHDIAYPSSESTDSEGGPPSPSPSPRPGSAMSTMSMTMMSRRSATPTVSGLFGHSNGILSHGRARSGSMPLVSDRERSVTVTTTTTTNSGLLSIPSAGHLGNMEFMIGRPKEKLSPAPAPVMHVPNVQENGPQVVDVIRSEQAMAAKTFSLPDFTHLLSPRASGPTAVGSSPTFPFSSTPPPVKKKEKRTHVRRKSSPPRIPARDEDAEDHRLRELERRHTYIMRDVGVLESRLEALKSSLSLQ